MVEIPTTRKRFNPAGLTAWDHERLVPDVTLLELLLSTAIEASAFRSCRTKSVNSSAIQAKVFLVLFLAELIVIVFAVIIVSGNWATECIEEVPLSGMDARREKYSPSVRGDLHPIRYVGGDSRLFLKLPKRKESASIIAKKTQLSSLNYWQDIIAIETEN